MNKSDLNKLSEILKQSGERAMKRHAEKGLPIVYGENGKTVYEFGDGKKVSEYSADKPTKTKG